MVHFPKLGVVGSKSVSICHANIRAIGVVAHLDVTKTSKSPKGQFSTVPELCQNRIHLVCRELLFEREQLPQVVDTRHIQIELIECLEPGHVLRNQQVAGSIPGGGSNKSITYRPV